MPLILFEADDSKWWRGDDDGGTCDSKPKDYKKLKGGFSSPTKIDVTSPPWDFIIFSYQY